MKTKIPRKSIDDDDESPSVLSQVVVKRLGGTMHQEPQRKRRRSGRSFVRSFAKGTPLIQQFDEIVKSAKQSAVKQEPLGSRPVTPGLALGMDMTPPRELRVKVEYLTPERIQHLNSSFDAAPSPITPPFSQPYARALRMEEEEDVVPSPQVPQGTTLTSHSMQCDLEPPESNNDDSDPLFLDAEDSTPENNNSGVLNDIDVLIDELLEKNPADQNNQGEPSALPELDNLNLSFEDAKSITPSNKSCSEIKGSQGEAPSSVLPSLLHQAREMATEILSTSVVTEDTSTTSQCKAVLTSLCEPSVPVVDVSKNSLLERSIPNAPPASMSTQHTGTIDQEAFSEDLDLSCSQLLDIDAQCNLLHDQSQKVSQPGPSSVDGQGARQPESKEEDPGFSIPAAPTLNWMQKAIESSLRLRAVTQELSRLNAMVLRARKTLWPEQEAMPQPQQHQNPISNHNITSPPPVYPYHQNSESPLMLNDQDWNIC